MTKQSYQKAKQVHLEEATRQARLASRLALLRLATFVAFLAVGVWALYDKRVSLYWCLPLLVLFMVWMGIHDSAIRRKGRAQRAANYYTRGLARIQFEPFDGDPGLDLAEEGHPYAHDFDLFGQRGLFARLSLARTQLGRRLLARWLMEPAARDTLLERQAAVQELAERVDVREAFAAEGDTDPLQADPKRLVEWAQSATQLPEQWPLAVMPVLALSNLTTLVLWLSEETGPLPFVISAWIAAGFGAYWARRAMNVLAGIHQMEAELQLVAAMLGVIEKNSFSSSLLQDGRERIVSGGLPPSAAIRKLAFWVQLNDSRRNMIFGALSRLVFIGTLTAIQLDRWRQKHGQGVQRWLETVAEFEALVSAGAFAVEHPRAAFPEICEGDPTLTAEAVWHPLLELEACVSNTVDVASPLQLLVVSGSNMSGKSTYLRAVGVNVALALAGAPVCAESMRLTPWQMGASMRISDSLQDGISHFYAELRRLKQIVDLAEAELPLLFFLDEILHGTNSHDRRLGAEAVLDGLIQKGASGFVTTHDLALTQIASRWGAQAHNVHFADDVVDGKLHFDYRKREGVVERSNALQLMREIGWRLDDSGEAEA